MLLRLNKGKTLEMFMEDDEETCSLFLGDDEGQKEDPKEDSEMELYTKFLNYILIQCSGDKFLEKQ